MTNWVGTKGKAVCHNCHLLSILSTYCVDLPCLTSLRESLVQRQSLGPEGCWVWGLLHAHHPSCLLPELTVWSWANLWPLQFHNYSGSEGLCRELISRGIRSATFATYKEFKIISVPPPSPSFLLLVSPRRGLQVTIISTEHPFCTCTRCQTPPA